MTATEAVTGLSMDELRHVAGADCATLSARFPDVEPVTRGGFCRELRAAARDRMAGMR